jgi:lysophospholipase L1-like esterase
MQKTVLTLLTLLVLLVFLTGVLALAPAPTVRAEEPSDPLSPHPASVYGDIYGFPPGSVPLGPGDSYLALGDSLVTGTEAAANDDDQPGYPAWLSEELQGLYPNLSYHNLGKDGETSSSMISEGQLAEAEAFIASQRDAGQRVGLITLSIGGNDMVPVLYDSSLDGEAILETFRSNLDTILARLLAAMTVDGLRQGDILLMDYYNPYPGLTNPVTGEPVSDTWVPQFNAIIDDAAATYGLPVAGMAEAFSGNEGDLLYVNQDIYTNPYLLSEALNPNFERDLDYHPRPAGHALMADVFRTLSRYDGTVALVGVTISGATMGKVDTPLLFDAAIRPATATTPITYTWSPTPQSGQGTSRATYTWATSGPQTITVVASNVLHTVTDTHTLLVAEAPEGVEIQGPGVDDIAATSHFTAAIRPATATTPITYTWSPTPQSGQGTAQARYTWSRTGPQTLTVVASNGGGTVTDTHPILIGVAPTGVTISGPETAQVGTATPVTATIQPATATTPITYTWSPTPQSGQATPYATYTWTTSGPHTITVEAANILSTVADAYSITVAAEPAGEDTFSVFLPLVRR